VTVQFSLVTRRPPRARRSAWQELALMGGLYLVYGLIRGVADDSAAAAFANGRTLLAVEQALHLDVELAWNAVLTGAPLLALLSSYWYATLHYLVTPAVLVWVYRSRPQHYAEARNGLVAASALGMVGFLVLPTAPPRMLPGYTDVLETTAGWGWWSGDASAPRGLGGWTNEFAAMPSLHVGWALWCAGVLLVLAQGRLVRLLAAAYPVVTTFVVVATANHYLLDVVAGAAVVAAGASVAHGLAVARPATRPAAPATFAGPPSGPASSQVEATSP
jgi:hypothetical protein